MKKKIFYTICTIGSIYLLSFCTAAQARVETLTSSIKQPLGNVAHDDVRIAAALKAKQNALEQAGTYLEVINDVRKGQFRKDDFLALAAGVLSPEIVSSEEYEANGSRGVMVIAKVDVDTAELKGRVDRLLKDRILMEKYRESQQRAQELLVKIKALEEQNHQPKASFSADQETKLKKDYKQVSQELAAAELNEKAMALWGLGKYADIDKAIVYLNDAVKLDPNYAASYRGLGNAYANKGDYETAIAYHQVALKMYIETLGPVQPSVGISYNDLGLAYAGKGDLESAISYYQRALDIFIKTLKARDPGIMAAYENLGDAYSRKGDFAKASDFLEKALAVGRVKLGPEHPLTKEVQKKLDAIN